MGAALPLDVILTLPACSWRFDLPGPLCLSISIYVPISLSGSRLRSAIEPCFYRQRHPPRCAKNTANLQRQCFASATQQHQEEWRYGGLKWLGFWKKNIQETYGNIWKPIGSSSQILGVPSTCSSTNKILGLKC